MFMTKEELTTYVCVKKPLPAAGADREVCFLLLPPLEFAAIHDRHVAERTFKEFGEELLQRVLCDGAGRPLFYTDDNWKYTPGALKLPGRIRSELYLLVMEAHGFTRTDLEKADAANPPTAGPSASGGSSGGSPGPATAATPAS